MAIGRSSTGWLRDPCREVQHLVLPRKASRPGHRCAQKQREQICCRDVRLADTRHIDCLSVDCERRIEGRGRDTRG